MYSLVSASVLALDLARHPSGAAVADAVDRVLALTPDDVHALAACATDQAAVRERLLAACATAPRMSRLMRGVAADVAQGLPTPAQSQVLLEVLHETLLGGLGDLLDLLRRELPLSDPALPAAGVQAALDAVAVAWAGRADGVDLAELAALRAPWTRALAPVPPALPDDGYGPGLPALRRLLDEVSRADDTTRRRVEQAHWAPSAGLRWSKAMHEACRAAVDTGRLVPVARAQLAAARALRLSGVSAAPGSCGASMAVTAAVQATCLLDVLPPECSATLLHAWRSGGPPATA